MEPFSLSPIGQMVILIVMGLCWKWHGGFHHGQVMELGMISLLLVIRDMLSVRNRHLPQLCIKLYNKYQNTIKSLAVDSSSSSPKVVVLFVYCLEVKLKKAC